MLTRYRELVNIPYWTSVYKRPWTRSAPYAIGIILGYLLHVCKPHRYDASKCSKWISLFGWYISTALAIAVLYSPSKFFDPGNFSEVLASVPAILYGCLHRFVWAVAVAWVIFACVTGHGKWVKGFLSWKPFVPLGRLSFCAFLCSYYVQMIHYVAQYHPVHYDIYSLVCQGQIKSMCLLCVVARNLMLCLNIADELVRIPTRSFICIRTPTVCNIAITCAAVG